MVVLNKDVAAAAAPADVVGGEKAAYDPSCCWTMPPGRLRPYRQEIVFPAPNSVNSVSVCRQYAALARRVADTDESLYANFVAVLLGGVFGVAGTTLGLAFGNSPEWLIVWVAPLMGITVVVAAVWGSSRFPRSRREAASFRAALYDMREQEIAGVSADHCRPGRGRASRTWWPRKGQRGGRAV